MKYRNDITQDELQRVLHYDPETGIFTWLPRDRSEFKSDGAYRVFSSRYPGKTAGNPCKTWGYIFIRYQGKLYRAHRLAWLYVYREWPKEEIDHINCDRADNRIENLREATKSENMMNTSNRSDRATSKYKNVYLAGRRNGKWYAAVTVNKKKHTKGPFDTELEAHRAASRLRKMYHGEFANDGP